MVAAAIAGIPPHRVFDYTFRMVAAAMEASERRVRNDMALHLWAHYQGQALRRTKRLPALEPLLRKLFPARSRVMSAKQQHRAIMSMAQAMGAKVSYLKKGP